MTIAMSSQIRRYGSALLDLVYPRRCEGCEASLAFGREAEERWLCDECIRALPRIVPPFCKVCGEPYDGAITEAFRCANCEDLKLRFDFAVAAYRGDDLVRELIHRFKYNKQQHLSGLLGALLARTLEDARLSPIQGSIAALIPVPLFHARQREREYNQAWELCVELSERVRIPALNALKRVRPTIAQASLTRTQRTQNLRGAFHVRSSILRSGMLKGKTVLLVDDVLTTGSTASECARMLRREAKVEKVVVITVARG